MAKKKGVCLARRLCMASRERADACANSRVKVPLWKTRGLGFDRPAQTVGTSMAAEDWHE
jgi:hypothetical protein